MFNIGGMELVVVAVLGLVVLGPQRLPGAVRQVGALLGDLRRVSDGFRSELSSALQPLDAGTPTNTDADRLTSVADPTAT